MWQRAACDSGRFCLIVGLHSPVAAVVSGGAYFIQSELRICYPRLRRAESGKYNWQSKKSWSKSMPSTEYGRSVAVASTVEITPIMPFWKHFVLAACCLLTATGCQESADDVAASVPVDSSEARSIQQPASSKEDTPSQSAAFAAADAERVRPTVYEFCTKCHAWPEPEHFPRWIWKTEINKAMGFYRQAKRAGRADYDSPPLEDIIGYYESYAPETITVDLSLWNVDASDHEFNPMPLSLGESENRPAIARTLWKSSTGRWRTPLIWPINISGG